MLGLDTYTGFQQITNVFAVKNSGVQYAYTKATDGTRLAPNGKADGHVAAYRSAGIPCGVYHYAQPGDPVAQAEVFAAEVNRLQAYWPPPALDMEEPGINSKREWSIRFLSHLRFRIGDKATAWYGSASWAASIRPDTFPLPNVTTWIAAYGLNDGNRYEKSIDQAGYTGRVDIHQYTSNGAHKAGIQSGGLDENWWPSFTNNSTAGEDMALVPQIQWDEVWEWVQQERAGKIGRNEAGADYIAELEMRKQVAQLVAQMNTVTNQLADLAQRVNNVAPVTGPVVLDATGGITLTPKNGV